MGFCECNSLNKFCKLCFSAMTLLLLEITAATIFIVVQVLLFSSSSKLFFHLVFANGTFYLMKPMFELWLTVSLTHPGHENCLLTANIHTLVQNIYHLICSFPLFFEMQIITLECNLLLFFVICSVLSILMKK